ncbi:MAG: NAD-glutamate dehydrogenase [Vicinamibacterales bacterium]
MAPTAGDLSSKPTHAGGIMITADPQRRTSTLAQVAEIVARDARPDDRELVLALAPVLYAEMPDALALRLSPDAIAQRLARAFKFIARTMPPAFQLYKGLPGLHVVATNPDDAEAHAEGSTHEVTIVETHSPDAPFIFESLKHYFQKEGLRVFSSIHPIFAVRRQWERVVWIGGPQEDGSRELYCQFRIERVDARERLRRIEHQVFSVLKAVFLGVEDFPAMRRAVADVDARLRDNKTGAADADAARAFLGWLQADNYVMLGVQRYLFAADGQAHEDQTSALGVFKDPALLPVVFPGLLEVERQHIIPAPGDTRVIDVDYCPNARAIHHLEPIDDVVIREWSGEGTLKAATLMLGRLAKGALTAKPQDVPLMREKLAWVLEHSGAASNSHAYREARALFNHFPRRELLYADAASLKTIIDRMIYLSSDHEIVVTSRKGLGYEAVSIAFSEAYYSHKAEESLRLELAEAFGPISFNTWADMGVIALLVFYFDETGLERPIDVEHVRRITERVISTWEDQVGGTLESTFGPIEGRRLFKRYVRVETRSGIYRESTPAEDVPEDVRRFETLEAQLETRVRTHAVDSATLSIYSPRPLGLTATLRTLENLALPVQEELSIPIVLPDNRKIALERLRIDADATVIASMVMGEARLREALRALQEGRATDDPLNRLVMLEGLDWRDVEVLRTLRNHLLQIRPVLNADTMNGVLLRNSKAAASLYQMFAARFDPAVTESRDRVIDESDESIRTALQAVGSLFDDEILRDFDNLIRAVVRTNAYQRPERPVFAIKVESGKVNGMVSPRPLFEIYVHSPKLEGIHLRGGRVARGGLRWSDRHDDFRTEILGLMQTQQLKNAVIVPVGSKGGFVLKGQLPQRPALDTYLIERYREFVSGLLDVTDNLVHGAVVNPPDVVRRDQDDPYLVVAADKGTAHLSDTANSVSAQYGFWLGDAFASGGSNGYDHKKEAITARGAWECVRHLFRNLGIDVQTQPFTCVGIGDMAGDVFGNGMLRSRVTKLVAAFNHQHIFLDPNPDPERSFVERARVFALPRSSWRDYDVSAISDGGGVFDRSAKAIPLSQQARAILDIDDPDPSGEEVIRAILKARVDLLYNGGIGTYVKASTEEDLDVGDRSNDRVRVDASDLRARVVGEGGNLGLTQRARLEFWTRGGQINTDAIDNSGGVDMSDHEVNIKILLDVLLREGLLKSRTERNALLREMTDEVSELVLSDNEQQALALTLDGLRSAAAYDEYVAFVEELVASGVMNRLDDAVPSREELLANPARDRGLPRPLLCVLMGRVKNWAFASLQKTTLPEDEANRGWLEHYFPKQLQASYGAQFAKHPLYREIIGTAIVNYLVNKAGIRFIGATMASSGQDLGAVIQAYLDVDQGAGAAAARAKVVGAGSPPAQEYEGLLAIERALERAVRARLAGTSLDWGLDWGQVLP